MVNDRENTVHYVGSHLILQTASLGHRRRIIGDRGRNDAPAGGDGIVPFRSAHYPGAVSEKIVPSGHDVHQHPEGVREIARILREGLGN